MAPTDVLLNRLLFHPDRTFLSTPDDVHLEFSELTIKTRDGERLGAWWIPSAAPEQRAHVLLLHGNAGNIGDRVLHARLLADAGFDTLLVDYRGYGTSTGSPDVEGTIEDARAARDALLALPGVDPARIVYLGESLGGGVAAALAAEHPPLGGLIMFSTFASIRQVARNLLPLVPGQLVPDAYPSVVTLSTLTRTPVLVLHGTADELIPFRHAELLLAAAAGPKHLHAFDGAGHNDLLSLNGRAWARTIAEWWDGLREANGAT